MCLFKFQFIREFENDVANWVENDNNEVLKFYKKINLIKKKKFHEENLLLKNHSKIFVETLNIIFSKFSAKKMFH